MLPPIKSCDSRRREAEVGSLSTVQRHGTWAQVRDHQFVVAFVAALAIVIVGAGAFAWFATREGDGSSAATTGLSTLQAAIAEHEAAIEGALGVGIVDTETSAGLEAALAQHEALIEGVLQTGFDPVVATGAGPTIEELVAQHEASIAGALGVEGFFEPESVVVTLPGPTLEELIAEHDAAMEGALAR